MWAFCRHAKSSVILFIYFAHELKKKKKWKTESNYSNSKWEGRSRTSTSQTAILHFKPQTAPQMKENTSNYTHPHASRDKLRMFQKKRFHCFLLLKLLYFATVDLPCFTQIKYNNSSSYTSAKLVHTSKPQGSKHILYILYMKFRLLQNSFQYNLRFLNKIHL